MEELRIRLKRAMNIRNLSQIELSEKTGIPKSSINQYLSGYSKPKDDRIFLLSKALDVTEAWLMGFDVPMDKEQAKEEKSEIHTIAAHAMEDLTEEEMEDLRDYIKFLKSKRK